MSDQSTSEPARAARPGDVCVLLKPSEDDVPLLRRRQRALQARFGGCPHKPVHLTCQRFSLQEESRLPCLVRRLKGELASVRPFDVVAVSLVQVEHTFWQSRLLRWRIRSSDPLRRFEGLVERALLAEGIAPHYLSRQPMYVTALEATPEVALERCLEDMPFPHHLFTGRQVVLSEIKDGRAFEILETIQLSDD